MTADEFRAALWAGRGSAILYAREHDVSEFRDIVLDAFLHCRAYDPQVEGTRGSYMLELVDLLPDAESCRRALIASLASAGDDRDGLQRYWTAAWMGEEARRAMYEHFSPGPAFGESIALAFVAMDKREGFEFAVRRLRELAERDVARIDFGYLESKVTEDLGEGVWEASADAVRYGELAAGRPTVARAGGLPSSDLEEVAAELLSTSDEERRVRLLRVFSHKPYPGDVERLMEWARGDDERFALAACAALRMRPSAAVRQLAIEFVGERRPQRAESIAMLSGCAEPGDHEMVLAWFQAETDIDVIHDMGLDLCAHWRNHPEQRLLIPLLEAVYERTPCSECRSYAVDDLLKASALRDEYRRECAFDANVDIREMVKAAD